MKTLVLLAVLAAPLVLYCAVIRPRGARILATYRAAGGGWAGVKAVLWNFQSWIVASLGAIAYAAPDILAALAGIDFHALLPEPWGGTVATAVAVALPVLRALATTPGTAPPSGEA